MSLRQKLFFSTAGILALVLALMALYTLATGLLERRLRQEQTARLLAALLAERAAAGGLDAAAAGALPRQEQLGVQEWALFAADFAAAGRPAAQLAPAAAAAQALARRPWAEGEVLIEGELCTAALVRAGRRLGFLRARIAPLSTAGQTLAVLCWVLGLGLVASALCATILVSRHILRPLAALVRAGERVAGGELDLELPACAGQPELRAFVAAFNRMLEELRGHRRAQEETIARIRAELREQERHLVIAQRLAAAGQLAAGIAHEIGNPLGGMLNAARALRGAELAPAKRAEYLDLVQAGLERLNKLVQRFRHFFRHEIRPAPLRLAEAVEGARAFAAHRLQAQQVRFVADLAADLPPVYGDAASLEQVFLNLFLNALDAMPAGGELNVTARVAPPGIQVVVADSGAGMDEATLARAFDLFFTTRPPGQGSGLGLAIAHQIIAGHEGTIRLESAPGKGTRVMIGLPAAGQNGGGAASGPSTRPLSAALLRAGGPAIVTEKPAAGHRPPATVS